MKQRSFLLCMLTVLSSLNVLAYDFESDGIYYTITGSNTVSVVSGDYAYDGDVTIPQAVGLSGKTYLVTDIGENAFKSTTTLESVTLPEGLIIIGKQAFYQSGVKTVSLPSTLSSLGASAFRECKNLQGIVLPDALKDVAEYSFYGCSNLKTVSFGNQTVSIENNAFENAGVENVVIPNSVKTIGAGAFQSNSKLKSLVINNASAAIGAFSFFQCGLLEEVDLGNAVYDLGTIITRSGDPGRVFYGCKSLKTITLPSTLLKTGKFTFDGCTKLYDVKLPNTMTEIEENAFSSCAITEIELPSSLTYIGVSAFSNNPLSSITFPSSLKIIGGHSFAQTSLKEVIIPASVTNMDDGCFGNCESLKKVKVEDANVTLKAPFFGCSSLEEVDLGNSLVVLNTFWLGSTHGCFENCVKLTSVHLPNTITDLPGMTFSGCSSLESISLPNTLISIGESDFGRCNNLKLIALPNTLQSIGGRAFEGCSKLQTINLPPSLSAIGTRAFSGCTSLTDVFIPEYVTSLGNYAFSDCIGLESVVFDNSVLTIQSNTFDNCTNLKNVELGKVTSIDNGAFQNCVKLESIDIPNSVETMTSVFKGCSSLKKVIIGTGLNSIKTSNSKGCFEDCVKLVDVVINSNVLNTIGENTFKNCRSLKKIAFPSSVTSIGSNSFAGCSVLSQIYMNATTPPTIQANTFSDYTTPTLHVPSSAKTAYTRADNWKNFTNVIAIGSEPKATAEEIAALETLLGEAQALYNAAVEGTEPGNYRPGAKAALKAVINEVSARIVENMLKEDVEDCTELLNTAIRSFKNKQVKNEYQTDNTLAFASSLKASRGAEFRLPIEMNNVNEISAVQFDLYLPEGMLLSTDEYGDYQIELGDRTTTRRHSVSSRVMSDGALRVVVSSTQNATFTGNSGTLLSLVLFPQTTMEAGDYDVELKNIVLTDPQATRYAAADMKSVITVSAYTMGDVNNDTHIDVADLTGVVLFILENADASLVFNAADMDGNGVVEVNDYAALVNVILAQNAPAGSRMSGKMEIYPNIISLSDMTVNANGEGELIVNLINKDRSYTGLQFDLYLPEGIQLNTETAEAVGHHHGIWAQKHADGYYRVICSSMMNDELNEGAVMRLQVKATNNMQGAYHVQADDVVLSDANAQRHEAANAGAQLMIGDEATGIVSVETAKQLKNVYDMQGRRVNAVKKGVYMVNGKKVVVR